MELDDDDDKESITRLLSPVAIASEGVSEMQVAPDMLPLVDSDVMKPVNQHQKMIPSVQEQSVATAVTQRPSKEGGFAL